MSLKNFRDIGGYASKLGGTVKLDRVFRSSQPSGSDAETLGELVAMDFQLIVDLRHPLEQAASPSPWPAGYTDRLVHHSAEEVSLEAPHLAIMAMRPETVETADSYYLKLYEDLPYDPAYRRVFLHVLSYLATPKGRILIHCTLGKDRTGVLVALIHSILGVSWDDIMADFIKSGTANDFGPTRVEALEQVRQEYGFAMPGEVLNRLISVQPTYLPRFFASINKNSGSVDSYLDEIGVGSDMRENIKDVLLTR